MTFKSDVKRKTENAKCLGKYCKCNEKLKTCGK